MASLVQLPVELAVMIVDNLHHLPDLAALALSCRAYFEIVDPILYKTAVTQLELHRGDSAQVFIGPRCVDRSERPFKLSPLIWAAKEGLVSTLQKTLAAGANPTHIHAGYPPDLQTPLPSSIPSWAVNVDDTALFSAYLEERERHSKVNEELPLTFTALHVAVQRGSTEVLKLLLDHPYYHGCPKTNWPCCLPPRALTHTLEDPSPASESAVASWPALHLALCARQQNNAQMLVSHRTTTISDIFCPIHPSEEFHQRFTPYHLAAASGQLEVLEMMTQRLIEEKGADNVLLQPRDYTTSIDNLDSVGLTPLYHAIAQGHWDTTVPYLVNLGADINIMAEYNIRGCEWGVRGSLLAELCRLGRSEDACKLLDQPRLVVDRTTELRVIDLDDSDGSSASKTYAIPFLHLCCMEPLQGQGSEHVDREKWTPVLIKKLVDRGLDPNYPWGLGDDPGSTPLIVAARHGNLSAINGLIEAGANVRSKTRNGRNALMAAIAQRAKFDRGYDDTESPSRSEFKELWGITSTLRPIPLPRLCEVTERLLEAGIPINEQDHDGLTALHLFFHGPTSQPFVPTFVASSKYSLSRNRPLGFHHNEEAFLQLLLCKGADPFVGCGIRDRSVLWTLFAGLWSRAAGPVLSSHYGPLIKTYLSENPDQLRAMFLTIASAHAGQIRKEDGLVEVLERLLDLDTARHLTTDPWLLQDILDIGLAQIHGQWTRLLIMSLIGRMDLEKTGLDPLTTAHLSQKAIQVGAWDLATELIGLLDFKPELTHDDSEFDEPSPISLVHRCFHGGLLERFVGEKTDEGRGKYIIRALDAGTNAHAVRYSSLFVPCLHGIDDDHTALSWAIFRKWAPMVELMLQKQPIPQGHGASDYLFYLLKTMWEDYDVEYKTESGKPYQNLTLDTDVSVCHRIMTALLAAGADPSCRTWDEESPDQDMYPLNELVYALEKRPELVEKYKCWFEPLSRGLDFENDNELYRIPERISRLKGVSIPPSTT